MVQDDKRTLRWHLESVYEQSGIMPAELDVPPLPVELAYLYNYFLSMNAKRTCGASSANPLSDLEILAWQQRRRIELSPFELDCIDALDIAFLTAKAAKT